MPAFFRVAAGVRTFVNVTGTNFTANVTAANGNFGLRFCSPQNPGGAPLPIWVGSVREAHNVEAVPEPATFAAAGEWISRDGVAFEKASGSEI